MRGEHVAQAHSLKIREGSSPHARGAPLSSGCDEAGVGIIPACAGSTLVDKGIVAVDGDHPRMRGEHLSR